MNAIGIALVWCIVQVTLFGLLAGGLYLLVRRLNPAAAESVVLTGLAMIVLLTLLLLSPWPRWTIHSVAQSQAGPLLVQRSEREPEEAPANQYHEGPIVKIDNFSIPHAAEAQGVGAGGDHARSAKDQPSRAAILGQAGLDELARPQATVPTGAWQWPGVLVVLLLSAMACGLGWLMLGVAAVRWQRLRSRPVVDTALLELVNVLCAELGCRRTVEVRQSNDLATAATIGWRRPVLLLPPDWTTWTADQRRAVLAHEIAHARSNDFMALLVGQIGLALHFYHPLLHWLIGRLRLEQELAADAAAADVSGGRQQYLTTIAELALRQQDGTLLWPARTFFFSQTIFLRRIAVLKDSKLRFDRLSPLARLVTVAAVLLCGLLVAGLREPSVSPTALGAESETPPVVSDSIDTTYLIENASLIVIMRPAAVFSRPELAPLAKLLERSADTVHKGMHMADFRQITLIMAGIPSGPRDIFVSQWVKPIAEESLRAHTPDLKFTVKEYDGKKLYLAPGGRAMLICDAHTMIEAGSEQAMGVYLAGKPGVLPKWLPAKAWESFRDDHLVIAADPAVMRREMKPLLDYSSPVAQAALLSVSSLWEDTTSWGAGARLDDRLAAHAWAAAKDADSAEKLQRTAEAIKTLAGSLVKNLRTPSEAGRGSQPIVPSALLDEADRLLGNMNFQLEGNSVKLQTSVELAKARLGTMVAGIVASAQPPDASTKNGMMALVEDFFKHNFHDVTSRETIEWGEVTKTAEGNFSIRYKYRAKIWDKETKIINQIFTFDKLGNYVSVKDVMAAPETKEGMMQRVEDFFKHNFRDVTSRETIEWGDVVKNANGNISIRYKYVAKIWDKETKIMNQVFTFDPKGDFVSVKDAQGSPANAADDATKSENALSNPGAEKGDDNPDGWEQGPQIDGVKYLWDKNAAFEGKASLCIVKTANRYFPIAQWSQTVVRKGDLPLLEVSAQVKTAKMFKAVLDVVFLDKDGQWISHHWAAYIGSKKQGDPPANHEWKKYSGTVEIPPGTAKICVALQDYGPGKVWFDDIRARYVRTPAKPTGGAPESEK